MPGCGEELVCQVCLCQTVPARSKATRNVSAKDFLASCATESWSAGLSNVRLQSGMHTTFLPTGTAGRKPCRPPTTAWGLLSWLQVFPACLHLSTSHHRADGGPLTRLREGDKESTHFRCISDKGKRRGSA